ncbi:50S ribosomal protein L25/general stress protein Ctc [soil metagenome]
MSQDTISLSVQAREIIGKQVRQLRRADVVPAVIHNHGKESVNVQADYNTIMKAYKAAGRHHPVELDADGKKYLAIIKTATFEPKKNRLTHVVFNAVNANQKVEAAIPVKPQYAEGNESTPAERASLIVLSNVDEVMVEAVPSKLPDVLYYDAEKLVAVGDSVTVADLIVPAGVEVKAESDHTIATVYEPSAVAAANDDAGGDAEPEDAASVDSEHESSAEEGTQDAEIRPGGKEQKESKDQGHNPEKQ